MQGCDQRVNPMGKRRSERGGTRKKPPQKRVLRKASRGRKSTSRIALDCWKNQERERCGLDDGGGQTRKLWSWERGLKKKIILLEEEKTRKEATKKIQSS